jgi:hypothetical protein
MANTSQSGRSRAKGHSNGHGEITPATANATTTASSRRSVRDIARSFEPKVQSQSTQSGKNKAATNANAANASSTRVKPGDNNGGALPGTQAALLRRVQGVMYRAFRSLVRRGHAALAANPKALAGMVVAVGGASVVAAYLRFCRARGLTPLLANVGALRSADFKRLARETAQWMADKPGSQQGSLQAMLKGWPQPAGAPRTEHFTDKREEEHTKSPGRKFPLRFAAVVMLAVTALGATAYSLYSKGSGAAARARAWLYRKLFGDSGSGAPEKPTHGEIHNHVNLFGTRAATRMPPVWTG